MPTRETQSNGATVVDTWTHDKLVGLAVRWLKRGAIVSSPVRCESFYRVRCHVVFSEIVTSSPETPDAIGFYQCGDRSILVECKRSRSDFRADANKHFRRHPDMGIGDFRYYLAPTGLISESDLPPKWGLIEPASSGVTVVRVAEKQDKHVGNEVNILWSAVRRLKSGREEETKPIY